MNETRLRVFQTLDGGSLLIKFQVDWGTSDVELVEKFGDPEINVGGEFPELATATATFDAYGTFTDVTVVSGGTAGMYAGTYVPSVVIHDPGSQGYGATFETTVSGAGLLTDITVLQGGLGYDADTTITIAGGYKSTYSEQYVKLYAGFPYTRRIDTISVSEDWLATTAASYIANIQSQVQTAILDLRALKTSGHDLTSEAVITL